MEKKFKLCPHKDIKMFCPVCKYDSEETDIERIIKEYSTKNESNTIK